MYLPPCSPQSAPAMSHGGGRCPARGRSYSRTWGTTSTGGSSGDTPDEETGAVTQVPPFYHGLLPYHISRGDFVARVTCHRSAVQGFARPVYCLSPEGLRWWQFDLGKEDGGLDASGKCRVLRYTESSLGNAVQLRTRCVSEFLFDAILPAHVPESLPKNSHVVQVPVPVIGTQPITPEYQSF